MSDEANNDAEIVANAIATYLVEHGALSIGDQMFAMRCEYAKPWRYKLVRDGFDACFGMSVLDIAAGVDLALARLIDAAQEDYDTREDVLATAQTGAGKSHAGALLAKMVQP